MTLIDTGAQISVLPKHVYDALSKEVRLALRPSNVVIKVGNGTVIKCYGVAKVKFEFQGMTFEHDLHVVENTVQQPILGYDFLHETGDAVLRPSSHTVEINGRKLKLLDSTAVNTANKVSMNQQTTNSNDEPVAINAFSCDMYDVCDNMTVFEPINATRRAGKSSTCTSNVTPEHKCTDYSTRDTNLMRPAIPLEYNQQQKNTNDAVGMTSEVRYENVTGEVSMTPDDTLLLMNNQVSSDDVTVTSGAHVRSNIDDTACNCCDREHNEVLRSHDVRNDSRDEHVMTTWMQAPRTTDVWVEADRSFDDEQICDRRQLSNDVREVFNESSDELQSNRCDQNNETPLTCEACVIDKKADVENRPMGVEIRSHDDNNLFNVERSLAHGTLICMVSDDRHRLIRCCWNGFWEYSLSVELMTPDSTAVYDEQASGAPTLLVDRAPDVEAVSGRQHCGCSDRVYPSFSVESSCHNALCGLTFELVAMLSVNPARRGRACFIFNPSTCGSLGTSSIKCVSGVIDWLFEGSLIYSTSETLNTGADSITDGLLQSGRSFDGSVLTSLGATTVQPGGCVTTSSTCDIGPWSVSIERLTSSAESTTVDVAGPSDIFDALSSTNFSVCD